MLHVLSQLRAWWGRVLARLRRPVAPRDPIAALEAADPRPATEGPTVVHAGAALPVRRVPIRNMRRDVKREAQAFAEDVTGRPMSPKATRKLLKKLARAERDGT